MEDFGATGEGGAVIADGAGGGGATGEGVVGGEDGAVRVTGFGEASNSEEGIAHIFVFVRVADGEGIKGVEGDDVGKELADSLGDGVLCAGDVEGEEGVTV